MKLVIIGYGGHTKDILSIIDDSQPWKDSWYDESSRLTCSATGEWEEPVAYLDDDSKKVRSRIRLQGDIVQQYCKLLSIYGQELRYIIGINSSQDRKRIAEALDKVHGVPAPPLLHRTAVISKKGWTDIEKGTVFGPFTFVSSPCTIREHVHLNTGASVNQNSTVGAYSTLSPGARVCGDVTVGRAVQMGANSTVINLMKVGDDVILGAGAVVTRDIPANVTAVGVPARVLAPEQQPQSYFRITESVGTTTSNPVTGSFHYTFIEEASNE